MPTFGPGQVLVYPDNEGSLSRPLYAPGQILSAVDGRPLDVIPSSVTWTGDGACLLDGTVGVQQRQLTQGDFVFYVYDRQFNQLSRTVVFTGQHAIGFTPHPTTNYRDLFYDPSTFNPTPGQIRSVTPAGVVGPTTWLIPGGFNAVAVAEDDAFFYYEKSNNLKSWSLATNAAGPDIYLAASLPSGLGFAATLRLIPTRGTLCAVMYNYNTRFFELWQFRLDGTILTKTVLTDDIGNTDPTMNVDLGDPSKYLWVRTFPGDDRIDGCQFQKIRLDDGVIVTSFNVTIQEIDGGVPGGILPGTCPMYAWSAPDDTGGGPGGGGPGGGGPGGGVPIVGVPIATASGCVPVQPVGAWTCLDGPPAVACASAECGPSPAATRAAAAPAQLLVPSDRRDAVIGNAVVVNAADGSIAASIPSPGTLPFACAGDMLASGVFALTVQGSTTQLVSVTLYRPDLSVIASLPISAFAPLATNPNAVLKSDGTRTFFLASQTHPPTVHAIAPDGTVGQAWTLPAIVVLNADNLVRWMAVSRDGATLYYTTAGGPSPIFAYDLVHGAALPNLVSNPGGTHGPFFEDLATLPDGSVLVLMQPDGSDEELPNWQVQRYSAAGALLQTYGVGAAGRYENPLLFMDYGDPTVCWVKAFHDPTGHTSTYVAFNVADGSTRARWVAQQLDGGGQIPSTCPELAIPTAPSGGGPGGGGGGAIGVPIATASGCVPVQPVGAWDCLDGPVTVACSSEVCG